MDPCFRDPWPHRIQQFIVQGLSIPLSSHAGKLTPPPVQAPPSKALDNVAQELYRVVLFLVFYLEVWLAGQLPYLGEGANCHMCVGWANGAHVALQALAPLHM